MPNLDIQDNPNDDCPIAIRITLLLAAAYVLYLLVSIIYHDLTGACPPAIHCP